MNHEAINQRIQALESELAGLKAESTKPKKFTFSYEKGESYGIHGFQIGLNSSARDEDMLKNFRYRKTEVNAHADFQLQKELMCIGALAEQIDPDYKSKVIWDSDIYYSIYFHTDYKEYRLSANNIMRHLGVVYMTKDVALKVCEILNNKQVEL